jgi:hypothetical protein
MHLYPIPGQPPKGVVKAIVSLTPQHTKRFLNALKDNIRKYEQTFGEIKLIEEKEQQPKMIIKHNRVFFINCFFLFYSGGPDCELCS